MEAICRRTAARARAAIEKLGNFSGCATTTLDDGTPLDVRVMVDSGSALIVLDGDANTHPGNLNAPEAVVRSAVMYALRVLIDEPIPLNESLLEPVTLKVLSGMLAPTFGSDPATCPAVAGGNVETSQRLVDALLEAFGIMANSQGTTNSTIIGSDSYGFYETVCGGAGAGPGFVGADAVHTHMTNTAVTDPELLEHRYPLRLDRFAIRRGSGGVGRFNGGDGVVREFTFLEKAVVSLLTQRRTAGARGQDGGGDGEPGRQHIEHPDGTRTTLDAVCGCDVSPGDRLILQTPGGGAWGAKPGRAHRA